MKKLIVILLFAIMLTGCAHQGAHDNSDGTKPSIDEPPVSMPTSSSTDGASAPTVTETDKTEPTSEETTTMNTTTVTTTVTETTTPATTTSATTTRSTTTKATTTTAKTTTAKTTTTKTTTTKTTTVKTTTTAATTPKPVTTVSDESNSLMDSVQISEKCPSSASNKRSGVTYPTAVHKTYYSNTTKSNRGVNIILPANYNSSKKYPVLYLLHGIFCDEYSMLDPAYAISEISTNLAADGLAKEMIIVLPNMYASSDPNQQPEFGNNASILPYDNFINDLVNDLMPYIEKNYSVLKGRDNTAIAGFSMGGRESLFIGLQRPDLFAYCGAFSPAPGLVPGRDWAFEHPGQLKESELTFEGKDYKPALLMLCCGTKDGTVGDFPKSYHEIFSRNKVKHVWYEVPGADHDGEAVRSGFYNFVRYIF